MTKERGFTLIELLVVVSIVVMLSGTALATFLNYQARRAVQDDASNVADRLRTIQIKAVATEVPTGCASVSNYVVTLDGVDLSVAVTCPGVGSVAIPGLALTLADAVFENTPITITFDSRTVSASPVTIGICGNGHDYEVEVNKAANVGRPRYIGSC